MAEAKNKTQYGGWFMLRVYTVFVLSLCVLLIGGCGSSAERAQKSAYKAQGAVAKERLGLVDQYMKCVDEAGNDEIKVEACDSYLKAAEALK